MNLDYISELSIRSFIDLALMEDVGDGDHSTLACITPDAQGYARLLVKDNGFIAGVNMAERIMNRIDPLLEFKVLIKDGSKVKYGDIVCELKGSIHSILKGERLLLNCMQRMSGIATYTQKLLEIIKGTNAILLDTRKTTPNFRMMEKWAVLIGGASNHRYNLSDLIMLKDNHIDFAGGIENAIKLTKNYLNTTKRELNIEVETRTLEEVKEVLSIGGVKRIMFDNMELDVLQEAVNLVNNQYETEASGGINETTIRKIAETGVKYISVGALTHSIKSLDLSLKAVIIK